MHGTKSGKGSKEIGKDMRKKYACCGLLYLLLICDNSVYK